MTTQHNLIDGAKFQTKYIQMKFKYLCLKIQNGGYIDNTPQQLAAAAIAVINCTYADSDQRSVDCISSDPREKEMSDLKEAKSKLEADPNQTRKTRGEIASLDEKITKLNKLRELKTSVIVDIGNRTCDHVLATVASIYLSIIYKLDKLKNTNIFITMFYNLMYAKYINCKEDQRSDVKKTEIIQYYLNTINRINQYLLNINQEVTYNNGKPVKVSYDEIFANSEYGKQESRLVSQCTIETTDVYTKLKIFDHEFILLKSDEYSHDEINDFRMANDFIGSNIFNIEYIDILDVDVINQFKTLLTEKKRLLPLTFILTTTPNIDLSTKVITKTQELILFGVYKYRKDETNKVLLDGVSRDLRIKPILKRDMDQQKLLKIYEESIKKREKA
jgi:hypothetical protein